MTDAAGVQAIKIDWKEKRVDRWRDAAHAAQHKRKMEKSKCIERERERGMHC